MKIYIVVLSGPESNQIISLHKTYGGAEKSWNKVRLQELANCEERRKYYKKKLPEDTMYDEMISNLSCMDPKKIDNYPWETPHILKYNLEE